MTVLIGTNDVNATFSQAWEDTYRKEQKLPEKPTLAWYRLNVERIIDRLQSETDAQIVLLDLPMLGEGLASDMNRRVADYNAVLEPSQLKTGDLPAFPRKTGRLVAAESYAATL